MSFTRFPCNSGRLLPQSPGDCDRLYCEMTPGAVEKQPEKAMRIAILSIGLALMLSGARSEAAEVRALSVGSTQVAAKILAANFREQTGHTVAVTATAPFMIGKQLAANPFDLLIIPSWATQEHDDGDLPPAPAQRSPALVSASS